MTATTISATTKNRELFVNDPTQTNLPNRGTTTVAAPSSDRAWDVLRFELQNFVCTGEYEQGLSRILDSYFVALSEGAQNAAWVSGFYGSGKSHFVRVIEHLWRNTEFPDGTRARDLVSGISDDLRDQLKELDTQGKRSGGVWAAAGQVSGKIDEESMRGELLRIVFEAAGLPGRADAAAFALWLKRENLYDTIIAAIEAAGSSVRDELEQFTLSSTIATALLAARPDLAGDDDRLLDVLEDRFSFGDIDEGAFLSLLRQVLELQSGKAGEYPCTLIGLDELQAAINDNAQYVEAVRAVVQRVSQEFDGRVLIIATGQAQLTATALLERLVDRFPVRVHLSDSDINTVVREVALRKKPELKSVLDSLLTDNSGEIDRQFGSTKIQSRAEDKATIVADYPILPVRRRFQEELLQVDIGGTDQLRTQLRFAYEAARAVGDEPVGTVVSGDFWYDQSSDKMLGSGVLDRGVHQRISDLDDRTDDGILKSRICKIVFLLNLVAGHRSFLGIRPDEGTIADLLVRRLGTDAVELRKRVPELLKELVDSGALQRNDTGYAIETEEGANWSNAFRSFERDEKKNITAIVETRTSNLTKLLEGELGRVRITQGESKAPRAVSLHILDSTAPDDSTGAIPIWVRETDVTDAEFRADAAKAGIESPTVHVRLADFDTQQLTDAIAKMRAAEQTLQTRPAPTNDAGRSAQTSIKLILEDAQKEVARLLQEIVNGAVVLQSGGEQLIGETLSIAVERAAHNAQVRLYPRFAEADKPAAKWKLAFDRARQGNASALDAVGHSGEAENYAPAKTLLTYIKGAGVKGSSVRAELTAPPFGWPQDAIDALLAVLVTSGVIRVSLDHQDIDAAQLTQAVISKAVFRLETVRLTRQEQLAVRAVVQKLTDRNVKEYSAFDIPPALTALSQLSSRAGGDAPLPPPSLPPWVADLEAMAPGPEQAKAVAEKKTDLICLADEKQAQAKVADARRAIWSQIEALEPWLAQCGDDGQELIKRVVAIRDGRQLLDTPDPTEPTLKAIRDLLKTLTTSGYERLKQAREEGLAELTDAAEFKDLTNEQWDTIIAQHQLGPITVPALNTHDELRKALTEHAPGKWDDHIAVLHSRYDKAREAAAKLLTPDAVTVTVPGKNVHNDAELDAWIEQVRASVKKHLDNDVPVVIRGSGGL